MATKEAKCTKNSLLQPKKAIKTTANADSAKTARNKDAD